MQYSTHRRFLLLVLAIGGIAACAADEAPTKDKHTGKDTCVFFNSIYDWKALDDTHLVIWAPSRKNAYLVNFMMPLAGLRFADKLAFIDHNHDGRLCSFGMDAIGIDDHTIPQHSTISNLQYLDATAIAKLEEQYKTKLTYEPHKKRTPKEPGRDTAQ